METYVIRWKNLPDVTLERYTFDATSSGPRILGTEGDWVRIKVTNRLPEITTLHWHGPVLPNEVEGPARITPQPIPPGGSYTYEFALIKRTHFLSPPHDHVDHQQAFGSY